MSLRLSIKKHYASVLFGKLQSATLSLILSSPLPEIHKWDQSDCIIPQCRALLSISVQFMACKLYDSVDSLDGFLSKQNRKRFCHHEAERSISIQALQVQMLFWVFRNIVWLWPLRMWRVFQYSEPGVPWQHIMSQRVQTIHCPPACLTQATVCVSKHKTYKYPALKKTWLCVSWLIWLDSLSSKSLQTMMMMTSMHCAWTLSANWKYSMKTTWHLVSPLFACNTHFINMFMYRQPHLTSEHDIWEHKQRKLF